MNRSISLSGNCTTIYGPVRSRRHGLSLGINLGDADTKICTWGCVYCQCGHGTRAERPGESENLPEPQAVLARLRDAIAKNPNLDSVTIAGNSEPTTHPQFPDIVHDVLSLREHEGGKWVFNCLSNGSELECDRVRRACEALDEIWIKLDCGEPRLFQKLNRPIGKVGDVDAHLSRLARLKNLRIQTLLWLSPDRPELSNFTATNLDALLKCYTEVHPTAVHVTSIQRATAFEGLMPVPARELEEFAARARANSIHCRAFA